MKELWIVIEILIAGVGALFGAVIREDEGFIYALLAFVIIDYATGIMKSVVEKKLSSDIGFKGIFRKILIFAMVTIGQIFDDVLLKDAYILRNGIIFFYLANEGLSILENACFIGLPVPEKLKSILLQLQKKDNENKKDDDKNESK